MFRNVFIRLAQRKSVINNNRNKRLLFGGVASCFLAYEVVNNSSSITSWFSNQRFALLDGPNEDGTFKKYTREEVRQHKTKENRIWVTYKQDVFDVTDFVEVHPGGNRILLAAGEAVDPFWKIYRVHVNNDAIKILQEYKIGELSDYVAPEENKADENIEFKDEPQDRFPGLTVYSKYPYNAGTIPELISDNYITPVDLTYVRNHHPVPIIDKDAYRLKLGWGIELSLNDLKTKFPSHEITATLICAGIRRDEFNAIEPVQGIKWKADPVSTAKYKGVWLHDLKHLISESPEADKHVWLIGKDDYDGSIPLDKAFSKSGAVMLAYEMNGEPINREHGGPLRVIVPGYVAARSIKWIQEIKAAEEEIGSPWQQGGAYKSFGPYIKTLVGFIPKDYPSIQEMPVQSNMSKYVLNGNEIEVNGWAYSGGGRKIIRVEVSKNGGKTWQEATLAEGKEQGDNELKKR